MTLCLCVHTCVWKMGDLFGLDDLDDDEAGLDDLATIFEREISDSFASPTTAARQAREIRSARVRAV